MLTDSCSPKDAFNDAKLEWEDLDDLTQTEIQLVLLRQRIVFLRSNLDRVIRVHDQLVHSNGEKCDLPKLKECLRAMMERVQMLEIKLEEGRESADHKRCQFEMDGRIENRAKEPVKRSLPKHNHAAIIVKPVRAGQQPASIAKPMKRVLLTCQPN